MSDTSFGKVYTLANDHDQRNQLWPQDRIARLVAILDSQPDSVTIINRDHKVVDMNPSGVAMIGAESVNDIIGKELIIVVDELYHQLFNDAMEATFRGEVSDIEYNITALNGEKRRMSQRSAPIFSRENPAEVMEMVTVIRDITEQYHGHMELVEAKAEAEEAYHVKSAFLATMSHELRTPLNAILGFSEIMIGEAFGKLGHNKYEEYVRDIFGSGKHLLELINDVLYISEIEAKKGVIVKDKIDVRDSIVECINTVSVIADQKNIDIGVNIDEDIPPIIADPRSFKQILINLLSNAIKFSHDGGNIILKARKENDRVTVSVKDNGIGISKEYQQELTKPFYRVQENAQISTPGTGLGLSIVNSLLEAHNGELKIESAKNKGTIVSFTLPIE